VNESQRRVGAVHDEPNTPRRSLQQGYGTEVPPPPDQGIEVSPGATWRRKRNHGDAFKKEMTPVGAAAADLAKPERVFTRQALFASATECCKHAAEAPPPTTYPSYHAARTTMVTGQHPSRELRPRASCLPPPRTPRPPPPHTDIINRLRGSKDPSFRPKQAPLAGSAGSQIWAGKTPAASRAAATRDARSGTSKSRRRRLREAPLPPPSRRPCHPPASRAKPEHKRSRHQQPIQVPPRP